MRHQEKELGLGLDELDGASRLGWPWRRWDMRSSGEILQEVEQVEHHSVLEAQQEERSELGEVQLGEVQLRGQEVHNEPGKVPEQVQAQRGREREQKMGRRVA